ncbi:MAG: hypothetical protein PHW96_01185 [Candidatus Nanoarchaeia archaeon]|nr:hypothetical protein [Candidatus Nanoarchaeia archaeon]
MKTPEKNKFKIRFIDVVFIIILALSIQFIANSSSFWGYVQFAVIYLIFIDYWFETNSSKGKEKHDDYELFIDFGVIVLIFSTVYFAVLESYAFYIAFAFFFLIDAVSTYIEYKVMKEDVWRIWKKMWVTNDIIMCVVLSTLGILVQEGLMSNMFAFITMSVLYFFLRGYVSYKTKIRFTYFN